MSADDPLLGAFEALRNLHDGKADGSETRQRVLAGAHRADSRHRVLYVFIPAAATLLMSVAWADGAGRLGPWRAALRNLLEPSHSATLPILPPKVTASHGPSLAVHPLDAPPIQTETRAAVHDGPSAPVSRAPEALPTAIPSPAHHVPAPRSAESVESSREPGDAEDELFAAAQITHFGGHDAASALHAWDAYLAMFPHGRFELEARYNRATTLLRLGRDDEARTALLPFAEGGYRRREALLLLEALGEDR